MVECDGMLLPVSTYLALQQDGQPRRLMVRFRTVGDMTCTGAVESQASSVAHVLAEVIEARVTERGASRADDRASTAAMERRKREGYF